MRYHVNQNKKSLLEEQAFRGSESQILQRDLCFALMGFAVLMGQILQIVHRPGSGLAMSAVNFALCMFLLGGSLLFYVYILFKAYRRARDYSKRAQEVLSLTDRLLCYSYIDTRTKMKVEFEIPISSLQKVERHSQMPLWKLTGEFELRISDPHAPDVTPSVFDMPCLLLGDYFDGAEDLPERLGCRTDGSGD